MSENTFDWAKHIQSLRDSNAVSPKALYEVTIFTKNIGLEQGQIRPGLIGRWDIYDSVCLPQAERLLVSGLAPEEIANEREREECTDSELEFKFPEIFERVNYLRELLKY